MTLIVTCKKCGARNDMTNFVEQAKHAVISKLSGHETELCFPRCGRCGVDLN